MPQAASTSSTPLNGPGIHVLAKPNGSACNIKCDYCFYLEKEALFPAPGHEQKMNDEVLAAFVDNYIASQATPEVELVWHGGEPTLRGLDFFRRVVELQAPHAHRKRLRNVIQTNGTHLTDEWCAFLAEHQFMVGLSLDGPREVHDQYRKSIKGGSTIDGAMRGLGLLRKHGVEFNILACVARETARRPLDVYHFFKEQGARFIQFTPIIEREPEPRNAERGLWLASPAVLDRPEPNTRVTPWTVEPEAYGDFLIAIYEEWVRRDVGETYVMNFEWALNAWIGNPSPICIHARQCGRAVAVEHDGSVYSCDHYVYPEYRIGNVREQTLASMVAASVEGGFGPHKETTLPRYCRECPVLQACWGGCPKHRFATTPEGEPGLHYLCAGYRKFFLHIRKYLHAMTQLLAHNLPPSMVMKAIDGPLAIPLPAR